MTVVACPRRRDRHTPRRRERQPSTEATSGHRPLPFPNVGQSPVLDVLRWRAEVTIVTTEPHPTTPVLRVDCGADAHSIIERASTGVWWLRSDDGTFVPCHSLFEALDTALGDPVAAPSHREVTLLDDAEGALPEELVDEVAELVEEAVLGWATFHERNLWLCTPTQEMVAVWSGGRASLAPRAFVGPSTLGEIEDCDGVRHVDTESVHTDSDAAPISFSYWEHIFSCDDLYILVKQSESGLDIVDLGRHPSESSARRAAEDHSNMQLYASWAEDDEFDDEDEDEDDEFEDDDED